MYLVVCLLVACFVGKSAASFASSCSEEDCGAVVSKCILMSDCKCPNEEEKCKTSCRLCLGRMYHQCCHCFDDMCPKQNLYLPSNDHEKSSIVKYMLSASEPAVFNFMVHDLLAVDPDWTVTSYVNNDRRKMPLNQRNIVRQQRLNAGENVRNCTVVFHNSCIKERTCEAICSEIGSARYRYFQNTGCCQCIGGVCTGNGLSRPGCKRCPPPRANNRVERQHKTTTPSSLREDAPSGDASLSQQQEQDLSTSPFDELGTGTNVNVGG